MNVLRAMNQENLNQENLNQENLNQENLTASLSPALWKRMAVKFEDFEDKVVGAKHSNAKSADAKHL